MMSCAENNPQRYYQIMQNYQEAQLLFAALRLNIFSHLDTPASANMVAKALNCNVSKINLLLLALEASKLIVKFENFYVNTADTKAFLSQNSALYLGEALLFREKMTSLDNLDAVLKEDFSPKSTQYDFSTLARISVPELYALRITPFISQMKALFPNAQQPLNLLDLGGGAGILSVEFTKHFSNSKATIFEISTVAKIAKEVVSQHNVQQHVRVVAGDFNTDTLGGPYDLIIASGIFNFVDGDISRFIQKLSASLSANGYLLIIGQFPECEGAVPDNILAWLSGFLNGTPLPPSQQTLSQALKKAGLNAVNTLKGTFFNGEIYQKKEAAPAVSPLDIVQSFIELTEQTANSKPNVLNFGSEDMTFYRGEIHMIKMIGDYPGIYSAELARKFGITRPVVHKTLQKLTERNLIRKQDDSRDKKRYQLFLTEKGWTAYRYHEKYHEANDRALFDFLSDMPENKLAVVKNFLDHAIGLIHNHT